MKTGYISLRREHFTSVVEERIKEGMSADEFESLKTLLVKMVTGVVVGLVEIAGAILLAVPRLTLYAAAALGIFMIGAVASEVLAGQG